jgi:mono/diheme cytochrome c family protein
LQSRHSSAFRPGAKCWRRLRAVAALLPLAAIVSAPPARARANQTSLPSKPASAETNVRGVAGGKAIFDEHCGICHYAESTAQKIGPGLKGLYTRMRLAGGDKVKDAVVIHWIESGGKNMPGFKDTLKPAQLQALIAYLRTL